jgi:DNA-binding phage protein
MRCGSSQKRLKAAIKTTGWDPAEYLESPESIATHLEAQFDDGPCDGPQFSALEFRA